MSDSKYYDLVVCGGGAVGLSIAYECVKNRWTVCVLDAGEIGKGSSWAGAGILPAGASVDALDPLEQLRALSHRLHPLWAEELLEFTGIDNEFRRCGGLYLARTRAERATLRANCSWWDDHGIAYQQSTVGQISQHLSGLKSVTLVEPEAECWWVPGDCRVRNPRHLKALQTALTQLGVEFLPHTSVLDFHHQSGRIDRANCEGNRVVRGNAFCVASGAWASKLISTVGVATGIMPVRGQMLLYKLASSAFSCVINEGHRYLVPRDDGHLLVGSCEEEVGYVTETTQEKTDELRDWAIGLMPVLTENRLVQSWAGLRPGSFDSYPYMGKVPGFENLFVAAGHFRHGLHWSTATGVLMQQLMFGEPTDIDLEPFRVLRGNAASRL
ncbi:MAG: NAD(P)/FAD-dependent oxidoreductase [Pirellula sp.]|jgi:glycine oxidase|nr:FAD-dependent oxidoreductase [Pirellula sp.]